MKKSILALAVIGALLVGCTEVNLGEVSTDQAVNVVCDLAPKAVQYDAQLSQGKIKALDKALEILAEHNTDPELNKLIYLGREAVGLNGTVDRNKKKILQQSIQATCDQLR